MKSLKIIRFGQALDVVEEATPQPEGSQILLRMRASGICHSDLHLWEGSYDLGRGKSLSLADRGINLPLTPGHEIVGEVVATGPDATDLVTPGKTYLVYPWMGCGTCPVCLEGSEQLCATPRFLGVYRDGGYADHILVPHPRYLFDLDGLDPVTAAPYACSGLTTYGALKKVAAVLPHSPIVLFGAGGLGLMCLRLLKAMGGVGAVVVDIDPAKRQAALEAGALAAVDGRAPDAQAQLTAALGGPARAAIDFVGSEDTARLGFDSLGKAGTLVIVGLFGGAAPWSLPLIPIKSATVMGSYVGSLNDLRELLDLVRREDVPPIPVQRCALHDASRALDDLRQGKVVGRTVLVPAF
ncbi:alcohol dehydrogenase [Azospirillum sp.]|uniref:alcohol dehydrogenase n=1 Tax=Azospirillum sp. TaxID=34012 RepID=UPI002D3902C3|nr:alcohol dehydrogenase [Azospirillum sp.]HYD67355.1 alcohol dehydrogenase [Azospirillum sp.]